MTFDVDGSLVMIHSSLHGVGRMEEIGLRKIDAWSLESCETINVTEFIRDATHDDPGFVIAPLDFIDDINLGLVTGDTSPFDMDYNLEIQDWENHYFYCSCEGKEYDNEAVCNLGNGTCSTENHQCYCNDGYYGAECDVYDCFGVLSNYSSVCMGHGDCVAHDTCSCLDGYIWPLCSYNISCGGIHYLETPLVCSGNGTCQSWDDCDCNPGYHGDNCEHFNCFGFLVDDTENVCGGRGDCVGPNICLCPNNSFSEDCSVVQCYGKWSNDTEVVCSGNAPCVEEDGCYCNEEETTFHGVECQYFKCFGVSTSESDSELCSGHGSCDHVNLCKCYQGYNYSLNCDDWVCDDVSRKLEDVVCSGHGKCVSSENCECVGEYEGPNCENHRCNNILYYDTEKVCSGNGYCDEPDLCVCEAGFGGKYCGRNNVLIGVMTPISVWIALNGLLLVTILGFACCCCCLCLCVFTGGIFMILLVILLRLSRKNKKFGQLENFDILLKEQKIEKDMGLDHIKIEKSLFAIDYDKIEIIKILGEGGSNSVVYLAAWRHKEVAFKCFKTRVIFSDQDSFDEFEREVKVLASVNHPHIIGFFGCTLKPPRVGIIMEYASKGDLDQFLQRYPFENGDKNYPYLEKLRILHEIVLALDYLHSRNVIHRDIKLENVLVDEKEQAKLMDFGLSRILEKIDSQKTIRVGTSVYMAPEVVINDRYTEMCDVFSFSILAWILFTDNGHPYGERGAVGIELKVAQSPNFRPSYEELEECIDGDVSCLKSTFKSRKVSFDWLKYLIRRCWSHEPKKRMSFSEMSDLFKKKMTKIDHEVETEEDEEKENEPGNEETSFTPYESEEKEKKEIYLDSDKREEKNYKEENKSLKEVLGKKTKELDVYKRFCEMKNLQEEFLLFREKEEI